MDINALKTKELQTLKRKIELELVTRVEDKPADGHDFLKVSIAQVEASRAVERAEIEAEWAKNPELKAEFLKDISRRNQEGVIEGALEGWWELDDNGNMSAPPIVFKLSDFADVKNPLMAHVMAKAEIFPSVGQARKNGWDKPLTEGEWTVTKKKIKIKVEK